VVLDNGFLGRISAADREHVDAVGRERRFQAGEVVMAQGAPSTFVALLLDGAVRVVASTPEGAEVTVSLRIAGDILGTLGVLTTPIAPRAATVLAIRPVRARVIEAGAFHELLRSRPTLAVELLSDFAAQWRESSQRHIEFGAYGAEQRLARLIVELFRSDGPAGADAGTIDLPLSQTDLAGMVGTSRESAARVLAKLRDQGLIETRRRAIHVVDLARLLELAGGGLG
jgi:CRP-like cAMP-binding protein